MVEGGPAKKVVSEGCEDGHIIERKRVLGWSRMEVGVFVEIERV